MEEQARQDDGHDDEVHDFAYDDDVVVVIDNDDVDDNNDVDDDNYDEDFFGNIPFMIWNL